MMIEFTVWAWKDIMKVCGAAVSEDEARIMLTFIKINCEENRFHAIGCNGYQLSMYDKDCKMSEPGAVEMLIRPQKVPSGVKRVAVKPAVRGTDDHHTIYYFDKNDEIISVVSTESPVGDYPYLEERVIKPAQEKLMKEEKYHICVNPNYLIGALMGMKDQESVVLHFADSTSAFMVQPFHPEDCPVKAYIYPVRTFGVPEPQF